VSLNSVESWDFREFGRGDVKRGVVGKKNTRERCPLQEEKGKPNCGAKAVGAKYQGTHRNVD